ncbi:MAG: hypothetical protein KJ749_14300 [Planctomycetes bacterium]|nr:hypothetical protein [Planctomycetota bacterium]
MFEGFESYTGQAAGLATSVLWTGTSLCFAAAGRRLGAVVVNGLRIAFAIVLLAFTYRLVAGQWIPEAVLKMISA